MRNLHATRTSPMKGRKPKVLVGRRQVDNRSNRHYSRHCRAKCLFAVVWIQGERYVIIERIAIYFYDFGVGTGSASDLWR